MLSFDIVCIIIIFINNFDGIIFFFFLSVRALALNRKYTYSPYTVFVFYFFFVLVKQFFCAWCVRRTHRHAANNPFWIVSHNS